MFKGSRFYKFVNKINPVIVFLLLLFISVIFDGAVVYGINNSSLVAQEKYIAKTQKESGTDIHIRFSLGSNSEASRLSLLSPINEYNAYRIKENGRAVSYILREEFDVTYDEDKTFKAPYVVYDDLWNEHELISHNRFVLSSGSYKDLAKEDIVYVSASFLKKMTGVTTEDAPGRKIKLSLDETKEFTIGGVVRTHVKNESGLHFKSLFDDCFVLFNSPKVNKYGFTDLLFASNDDMFQEDLQDFIKAYNKSYLSFDESRLTISSYLEDEYKLGYSLSPNYNITSNDHTAAFLSILVIVVIAPIFLVFLLFYDFNKVKLYYKIPASLILTGYHFGVTFFLVDKMKKGLFVSKLSLTMFIIFMIISLLSYIFAFVLFNLDKKEKEQDENQEEEINNG